jgi:hypothetical protein
MHHYSTVTTVCDMWCCLNSSDSTVSGLGLGYVTQMIIRAWFERYDHYCSIATISYSPLALQVIEGLGVVVHFVSVHTCDAARLSLASGRQNVNMGISLRDATTVTTTNNVQHDTADHSVFLHVHRYPNVASITSLSSLHYDNHRTTSHPQPQPHDSTTKPGKDLNYQNLQTRIRNNPKRNDKKCIGHP